MKFPLSWLKEYIHFEIPPAELAEKLTMTGLEVEEIEYLGQGLNNVVVAEILEINMHPNADKLTLCRVTDGESDYNIVCGATNMKSGDKVVLAKIGAKLPPGPKFIDGLEIKKSKIRGEASQGMLCAEDEIGLGDQNEEIIILPPSAKPGNSIVDELNLDDAIFEIGITPNRSDCLSIVGVAREVAAIMGLEVNYPTHNVVESEESVDNFAAVEVKDSEGCPRYSCRVIKDVKIGPSPDWLKRMVELSGLRPINNVVDVTNYILLELGQPLHAFDYDLLQEKRIVVRSAAKNEKLVTLDNIERELSSEDLLICDGDNPIALAGVMGGSSTEVSNLTKNILLESAFFDPSRVRKASRKTGLISESSYRFERGVDPNGVVNALDRASELIREVAGGSVAKGKIDIYPKKIEQKEVKININRTNSILGTELITDSAIKIFESLGFMVIKSDSYSLTLKIPTFRFDIEREIDLIEEIARVYGYENIRPTLPNIEISANSTSSSEVVRTRISECLISNGFLEVINYSFDDPDIISLFSSNDSIKILNPITKDGTTLRTSIIPSLLKNIKLNLNHQENDVMLYEIGKVYTVGKTGQLPSELTNISAAVTGRRGMELWDKEEFDFYDLKNVVETFFESLSLFPFLDFEQSAGIKFLHPGKSAYITLNKDLIGCIGQLHPDLNDNLEIGKNVYIFEVDLDKISHSFSKSNTNFKPLPKFPYIERDLSLVVNRDISVSEILEEINKIKLDTIENAYVFDVYHGGNLEVGKKSISVKIILRAQDKTLTDEEANQIQKKTLDKLGLALGAELRTI